MSWLPRGQRACCSVQFGGEGGGSTPTTPYCSEPSASPGVAVWPVVCMRETTLCVHLQMCVKLGVCVLRGRGNKSCLFVSRRPMRHSIGKRCTLLPTADQRGILTHCSLHTCMRATHAKLPLERGRGTHSRSPAPPPVLLPTHTLHALPQLLPHPVTTATTTTAQLPRLPVRAGAGPLAVPHNAGQCRGVPWGRAVLLQILSGQLRGREPLLLHEPVQARVPIQ